MVEYLRNKELSEKLGISRNTLYLYRKAGMPYISMGPKCLLYDLDEVIKWFQSRKEVKL